MSVSFWIAAHMISSSSMLIVNKAAVERYPPCSLIIYQAVVTLLVLFAQSQKDMEKLEFGKMIRWLPVATLFVSMLITSIYALEQIPIQTLIVFRNLTALGVAFGDFFILKRQVSLASIGCIFVMIFGAIQYSRWDVHFNAWGYFWAITNTLSTACYNLFTKWIITDLGMSTSGSTLYNNVMCLPFLFVTAFYTREFDKLPTIIQNLNTVSIVVLIVSGFIGFAISYAGFKVQKLVSATSFTVVVNVSKVVSIIVGSILFHTTPSFEAALGLGVSLIGAWLYAVVNAPPPAKKEKEK